MNVTFFMEQHLGHRSYYENLRPHVERCVDVNPHWVEITYSGRDAWWERPPLMPPSVRERISGRRQVLQGLRAVSADVVFFNTQAPAALAGRAVGVSPYVLATDITPVQYDRIGEQYDHRKDRVRLVAAMKHRAHVRLLRQAARIVPWSNWVQSSLVEDYGVDPERIEVVFPGVNLDFWRPGWWARFQTGRSAPAFKPGMAWQPCGGAVNLMPFSFILR